MKGSEMLKIQFPCLLCRLDANLMIKVADFGLTQKLNENNYYKLEVKNKALPVRWMSLEGIQDGIFTTQSDVVCLLC